MRLVGWCAAGTATGCAASLAAVMYGPAPALLILTAFMTGLLRWSWIRHPEDWHQDDPPHT